MAMVVERPNRPNTSGKYPWNVWFDGRVWQLVQGTDFTCAPSSLIQSARFAAGRRGLLLRTWLEKDTVTLQALQREVA